MTKFTKEEKIQAVLWYQSGKESIHSLSKILHVSKPVVSNWVKQHEVHGEKAFEKRYTSYSLPFKLDVLNYMKKNGTSSYEAAVLFDVASPSLIRNWRNLLETGGADALKPKKKGRPSMKKKTKNTAPAKGSLEALQAENERLRAENAYLKKLKALVQEREASKPGKKRK